MGVLAGLGISPCRSNKLRQVEAENIMSIESNASSPLSKMPAVLAVIRPVINQVFEIWVRDVPFQSGNISSLNRD